MLNRISFTSSTALSCAFFTAILSTTSPSAAQNSAAESGIQDIVVTARKTSENLQTTPVAVTALDSTKLLQQQVVQVSDLQRAAPSLSIGGAGTGPSSIVYMAIRGNAQNSPNSASDAAVGIYVDNVYYGRPMFGNLGLLDLSSAEILRGTQGTLFGRNTTGGALNLTTTQPGGRFEGYVRGTYGNFDLRSTEAALTVPLAGDQLSLRVAGRYSQRDGYGYNPITDDDLNRLDHDYAMRATLRIAPDYLPVILTIGADYVNSRDRGTRSALVAVNPKGNLARLYPNIDISDYIQTKDNFWKSYGNPVSGDSRIDRPYNSNKGKGVYGNLEVDLGSAKLRSITAYRNSHSGNSIDLDGTPAQAASFVSLYYQNQFSQEIQISRSSSNFDWIAGAYYFVESGTEQSDGIYLLNTVLGNIAPSSRSLSDFKASSKALFAQVNYRFTDQLRLTAGIRNTWDKRSINRHGTTFWNTPAPICSVAPAGRPCDDPHSASFSYPAWTLGLDYELGDRKFAYIKTGGAAMAGGFNTRRTPPGLDSFRPEKVKDIEVGFKGDFLDRRLRTNIALFHNWRDNAQNTVNEFTSGSGLTQYVRNAGNVRAYGFEFEGTALPWHGMEITGSVGYLHTRYASGSFIVNGLGGKIVDRSGESVPQAPKWTASVGATQTLESSWGSTSIHLDYTYISSRNYGQDTADPNNPAQNPADYATANRFSTLPGYGLLNGRVSVAIDNSGIDLSIWARNLTNTKYNQNLFNGYTSLGFTTQFQGTPRTYGATAAFRF